MIGILIAATPVFEPGAAAQCGDGVWGPTEYCGQDAFTATGVTEMNHDCFVDVFHDLTLFSMVLGTTDPSGDFNGSGLVDSNDLVLMANFLGATATPCTPFTAADGCAGVLALSFSSNPSTIVSTTNVAPGNSTTLYVVASGTVNAHAIEFALAGTTNLVLGAPTVVSGTLVTGCENFSPPEIHRITRNDALFPGGPLVIAEVPVAVIAAGPASIELTPGVGCVGMPARLRWTEITHNRSVDFATVSNAGINGPAPVGVSTCVTPPTPVEQHTWQDAAHFEFSVTNPSILFMDDFHLAQPRLVFADTLTPPDSSVIIKCCGIVDTTPMTTPPMPPDRWCRVHQDAASPLWRKEAWWYFPPVPPGGTAPLMDIVVSIPTSVVPDSLGNRRVWYEFDYFMTSGVDTLESGVVEFHCDPLVATDVGFQQDSPIRVRPRRLLMGNTPNPFNPKTTIRYFVDRHAEVRLDIYDVAGRRVKSLVRGKRAPDLYHVVWDGTDDRGRRLASGTYFYQLVVGDVRESRKLVLLK